MIMFCILLLKRQMNSAVLFSYPYIDNITLYFPIVHIKETLKSNTSCCNIYTSNGKHKSITFATVLINKLYTKSKCIEAYEGFRTSV